MKSGRHVQELRRVIDVYGLADRYPDELSHVVFMLQQGMLSDDEAMAYLIMIQDLIEELDRRPNLLPMAAGEDEIGTFDIELGELIERPGVRVGIRLLDRPRHVLVSGATGAGKSVLLRSIILRVDQLNRGRHDA